jgi:hypothetical protein
VAALVVVNAALVAQLDLDALAGRAAVAVVAALVAAPLDLELAQPRCVRRAGRPEHVGGGGRRARHQRPARAEVLAVVDTLAAVAMRVVLRWSRT